MKTRILQEDTYREQMMNEVEPYLEKRKKEMWAERRRGKKIHCVIYSPEQPSKVVVLSHGYTETAEKYKEIAYYFVKEGYRVYLPEHCGHGHSYRLTTDPSLVHLDHYERYVEDLLYISRIASRQNPALPLYLFGHSMGGGIAAAALSRASYLYRKAILTSPMIRPQTEGVPWPVTCLISGLNCGVGRREYYVVGQRPYHGIGKFENSSSGSKERFDYYQAKRHQEPLYQLNAASYGWLYGAVWLNRYLKRTAYKTIQTPFLMFQSEQDHMVSKTEQRKFIERVNKHRPGTAKLIEIPGTKHEIFNSSERVLAGYWKKVFDFFEEN